MYVFVCMSIPAAGYRGTTVLSNCSILLQLCLLFNPQARQKGKSLPKGRMAKQPSKGTPMKKNPLNPVWDYADKKKEGTKIYCICTVKVGDKVCGKEIACPQHSTTALRAHLKSFHRAQYLDVEVKQQCHCYINEKATNVIIKVKNCKPITTENIRIVSYKERLCTKVIVSNRTLAMKNDNV